jgi:hypothetical protein
MKSNSSLKRWMIGAAMATALLISTAGKIEAGIAVSVTPAPSASGAGVVVGIATALAAYDFARRVACVGDFFKLGGPGFDRPITPVDNVMKPQCAR